MVPAVTTPPGRDVVLECEVSGSPEGTLVWTRVDGGPLPASSVAVGTSLHLFSVSSGDAGGYMCTVTNTFGAVSGQLDLTVLGKEGGRDGGRGKERGGRGKEGRE